MKSDKCQSCKYGAHFDRYFECDPDLFECLHPAVIKLYRNPVYVFLAVAIRRGGSCNCVKEHSIREAGRKLSIKAYSKGIEYGHFEWPFMFNRNHLIQCKGYINRVDEV